MGLPMGISAISYLTVAFIATYIKNVTVNFSLFTDWFTFIIAIFFSNLIFFILITNFSNLKLIYTDLFYNAFFTFLFYPLFWVFFNLLKKIMVLKKMINFDSGNTVIKSKLVSRRMFILSIAKAAVFFGIFGRLVSLQINEATKYKTLSDKNRFREWKLAPQRGVIRDYFNQEIASNQKVYQLHITPENAPDLDKLLFRLKTILNLSNNRVYFLKQKVSKQKPWEPIIVSDNLTWSEFSRINLFLHELQGVEPIVSVARVYSDTSSAHLVGYVSKASAKDLQKKYLRDMGVAGISVGKTGLEHKLDEEIIGKVGFHRYEVNAFGKRIKQIKVDAGKAGVNYRTTIDGEIQKFVSKLLDTTAASVCVMDIYNGDIVSMVSSPTFDPNAFVHGIDKKYWNELISNDLKPLNNKAIAGLYPPGSTIKTLVALSALENDVWNPNRFINCTGVKELYGEKFHCWKKRKVMVP